MPCVMLIARQEVAGNAAKEGLSGLHRKVRSG